MPRCALVGGKKIRNKPFHPWPVYGQREEKLLKQVLRSRYWGGYPYPAPFYDKAGELFARAHDARYGLPVANGTVALEVALKACGIGSFDEVIIPPFTFVATAAAVLMAGAVPVFADVDPETWCISPREIEQKVSRRTRAVIPVHLGQNCADLDAIKTIARKHKLAIIEDCAHAHGGKWRGKGLGSIGDIGAFSFQTTKLLTSGEGGMVITNSLRLRDRMESLINCGRPSRTGKKARLIGYNYRITEFQAAIMVAQIERLDAQTEKREKNIQLLEKQLEGIPGIYTFERDPRLTQRHAYHVLLRFEPTEWKGIHRDLFVAALNAEGIPCDGLFYEPLYDSPLFQVEKDDFPQLHKTGTPFMKRTCPVAEKACYEQAVWLPHQLFLGSKKDIEDIAKAISKIVEHQDELYPLRQKIKARSRALRK